MGMWQQAIANRQARIANQGIMDNSAGFNNSRFLNQRSQQGSIGNAVQMANNNAQSTIPGNVGGMVSRLIGNRNKGIVPVNPRSMVGSIMQGRNIANQNQLTPTAINPNAFNTGTVGQVFQSSPTNGYVDPILSQTQANPNLTGTPIIQKKSSPIKQTIDSSVDPLTGQFIDPTVGQGINPDVVDPVPPPVGVEQDTIVPYEINNQ